MQDSADSDPSHDLDPIRVREVLDRLRGELLEERNEAGHWVGRLSASALSTATAVSAISAVLVHGNDSALASTDRAEWQELIRRGIESLRRQQNPDGGFGDTDRSHSNIATSYLVLAASALAQRAVGESLPAEQQQRLQQSIERSGEIDALRRRYGTDKTFVVPILTNLAIAGLVPWADVPRLPFEAAVFPQSMYRLLRMPVVSYAIPALVAIGQARHFCGPKAWLPVRVIRHASIGRTMKVLGRMQPESGGYLEATPLTSFVVMSLAVTGRTDNEVCRSALRFLKNSIDDEGSWPIDTNLATWVTSLAIDALASDPNDDGKWCDERLVQWHLSCRHRVRHPFTGAEPGGWGWSDLSGAVPDSDDTPAAILALSHAERWIDDSSLRRQTDTAVQAGVEWLLRLQNRDGGWPTFCRGWGKLPFDRSSNDLTAHAMRALHRASGGSSRFLQSSVSRRAVGFLLSHQQADGSWLPLWFGNQDREDESNPVYGTSRVLAIITTGLLPLDSLVRGCDYLIANQNADGGWGGGESVAHWLVDQEVLEPSDAEGRISSVEETALAVDALVSVVLGRNPDAWSGNSAGLGRNPSGMAGVESGPKERQIGQNSDSVAGEAVAAVNPAHREAIIRGIEFLLGCVDRECHRVPWPIGFYFAKLWYHERLYPLIFTVAALGKYLRLATHCSDPDRHQ